MMMAEEVHSEEEEDSGKCEVMGTTLVWKVDCMWKRGGVWHMQLRRREAEDGSPEGRVCQVLRKELPDDVWQACTMDAQVEVEQEVSAAGLTRWKLRAGGASS